MANDNMARAQAAMQTMADTRAEFSRLFASHENTGADACLSEFPRSKTFRWLMNHPIGRSLRSALVLGALARLPLGRLIGTWIPRLLHITGPAPTKDIL